MFTNNYIEWQLLNFMADKTNSSFTDSTGASFNVYRWFSSGSVDPIKSMSPASLMNYPVCNSVAGGGLYFGSGVTPATKQDYALESVITSGLTFPSQGISVIGKEADEQYAVIVTHSVRNISESAITIGEVGLFGSGYASASSHYYFLLERTVLSEPITIPAGGTKLVTYKITFNQGVQ